MLSRLLLSGSFPRIAGHYVLPQTHEGIEIVYYIKGRGITTIDGRAFAFDSGYVAVIPPNVIHDEICEEDGASIFCQVSTDNTDLSKLQGTVISAKVRSNKTFFDILNRLYIENLSGESLRAEYIDLLIRELVFLSYEICKNDNTDSEVIRKSKKYIEGRCGCQLDFNLLSEQLGYSYDRLRHIFYGEVGISPKQYLINCRISRACKLLLETNLSIERIAFLCGYGNSSSFIISFKKKMKATPYQYRNSVLENDDKLTIILSNHKTDDY